MDPVLRPVNPPPVYTPAPRTVESEHGDKNVESRRVQIPPVRPPKPTTITAKHIDGNDEQNAEPVKDYANVVSDRHNTALHDTRRYFEPVEGRMFHQLPPNPAPVFTTLPEAVEQHDNQPVKERRNERRRVPHVVTSKPNVRRSNIRKEDVVVGSDAFKDEEQRRAKNMEMRDANCPDK